LTVPTAYLLYLLFALGGGAVYFLLPQGGRPRTGVAAVLGASAVALWLVLTATRIGGDATSGYFYLFATIAVIAAARVITHTRPVYSALYFVVVVIAVAALLVLLQAEFLAVALIIIYAGAILVTYLFVIMLANQSGSPVHDRRAREPFLAVVAGFVLTAAVAGSAVNMKAVNASAMPRVVPTGGTASAISENQMSLPVRLVVEDGSNPAASESGDHSGNTLAVGELVMTKYVVPLQIGGVLLLISMVGAIAMSRMKTPSDAFREPRAPLGEIGKQVEPF